MQIPTTYSTLLKNSFGETPNILKVMYIVITVAAIIGNGWRLGMFADSKTKPV